MRFVVCAVLMATPAACAGQIGDHIATNSTDQTIYVYEVDEGRELSVAKLSPGARIPLLNFVEGECSATLLIARNESGTEIARRDDMFCPGDEWTINDAGSPGDSALQIGPT